VFAERRLSRGGLGTRPALGNVQEYLDLAISVQDRSEREFYEPIAEL
jgi:hypothetical protein